MIKSELLGSRRQWILAAAGIGLALLAMVAAYATLWTDRGDGDSTSTPPRATITLSGAFMPEVGPDGQQWRWLGDRPLLHLRGEGNYWIALRTSSLRRERTVSLRGDSKALARFRASPKPKSVLVGPVEVHGKRTVSLRTAPAAEQAPGPDTRDLSVFISELTFSRSPVIPLPAAGFWSEEGDRGSTTAFRWISDRAEIEIVAPEKVASAILTFKAQSAGGVRRRIAIEDARAVPASRQTYLIGAAKTAVRSPAIQLVRGRGRAFVTPTPRARPYGRDARRISVKIAGLVARAAPNRVP